MNGTESATLPRLLVLTDRSQLRLGRGLVVTITECVAAGLTHVVVREHDLAPPARRGLVAALAAVPGLCVISSRVPDPAAHGLHQPAGPTASAGSCNAPFLSLCTPPAGVEPTVSPRYTPVGRSCHNRAEVRRAARDGLDYVTLSPFAASRSKPGYGPALDSAAFADLPLPTYALGGIVTGNAAAARDAGAHGVAVMGAVMRAADPAAVVADLLEAVA